MLLMIMYHHACTAWLHSQMPTWILAMSKCSSQMAASINSMWNASEPTPRRHYWPSFQTEILQSAAAKSAIQLYRLTILERLSVKIFFIIFASSRPNWLLKTRMILCSAPRAMKSSHSILARQTIKLVMSKIRLYREKQQNTWRNIEWDVQAATKISA